ncbi:nucleotide exchange factor GrpE [Kribbella jiaozuonensis]|uniref:Protein GrpE n=1 Tax=Kribbella jiaozuonensis TaxID=2575441 RepID=A0A4U3LKT1_9ACTN|nr:nucleotide exchange factor GrpE [Kribbella jiaozuonensis]TKK76072.1 nucleotide exchange factor GrpE [Kribbella jiaozuonensis]
MADQETDTGAAPSRVDEALEEAREQAAEMEDRWRRTAAELDNFRKRVARESGQQRDTERALVAASWLPVVDNLELALEHADAGDEAILEGIRAVRDQALAVLSGLGYPQADDSGKPFDPALHEAVGTTPSPEVPAGTIVHVVRPRYGDGKRVLRPAGVVVAAEEG